MNTTSYKEPETVNWDTVGKGSTYTPPPPAQTPDGKFITYTIQLPQTAGTIDENQPTTEEGYRKYQHGPVRLVKSPGYDGYEIRFYSTSLKPFMDKKTGQPKDVNATALLLKAAGVAAKPQKTVEYDQAVRLLRGKIVPVTLDWRARSKDGSETIDGFQNFPMDPERPGFRKAILRQGDLLPNGQMVKSEVLFANAVVRFVQDPNRK